MTITRLTERTRAALNHAALRGIRVHHHGAQLAAQAHRIAAEREVPFSRALKIARAGNPDVAEEYEAERLHVATFRAPPSSDDTLLTIKNVEVFAAGEWNGKKYTEVDLEALVQSFGKVGYQVPLKLGHRDEPGERAYGWIRNLHREGSKLIADFTDLTSEVYQWIKARHYDAVSCEIYHNVKRDRAKFRLALKAVALLGAETPGVAGLAPLRAATFTSERTDIVTRERKSP